MPDFLVRWLAIAAVGAALFGVGYVKGLGAGDLRLEVAQHKSEVAQLQAEVGGLKTAALRTRQLQEKTDVALKDAARRAQASARATDAARAESDGLRDQLAEADRRLAEASAEAVRAYATAANAVLRDCQAKYLDMAGKAQGHANDVRTLEDGWPAFPDGEQPAAIGPPR